MKVFEYLNYLRTVVVPVDKRFIFNNVVFGMFDKDGNRVLSQIYETGCAEEVFNWYLNQEIPESSTIHFNLTPDELEERGLPGDTKVIGIELENLYNNSTD